ncbi:hypothetical protein ACET3Z_018300 [Daucus carota]
MEVTGLIAERFVKYVTEDDLFSDEMVVSLQNGGLHGIRFLTEGNPVHDELVPPRSFIDRCVNDLSLRCFVDYILSNGKKVSGGFNRSTGALCGFHLVGNIWVFLI